MKDWRPRLDQLYAALGKKFHPETQKLWDKYHSRNNMHTGGWVPSKPEVHCTWPGVFIMSRSIVQYQAGVMDKDAKPDAPPRQLHAEQHQGAKPMYYCVQCHGKFATPGSFRAHHDRDKADPGQKREIQVEVDEL